ncbi:MAG: hypothetical protein IJQ65_00645 [Kiritimatiellae bacterium]|nr:hypothetical protein [Kiritimatiellia bacterium]
MAGNIGKTLLVATMALTAAVRVAAETTHVLNSAKYGAATQITSALDWNDLDNWDAEGVPNSSDSFASISASLPAGKYAYVTSAVPVTLSWIGYNGAPSYFYRYAYVSDKTLTLAGLQKINAAMRLYAPVAVDASTIYTRYIAFCGPLDLSNAATVWGNYYTTEFRFDCWADSTDSVRVNPCGTDGNLSMSGATMVFVAPESSAEDVTGVYRLTAGSPFVFRASGSRNALPVGTTVTGDCVAQGAFVKRVFPDDSFELSAPAMGTSAASTLTFAARTAFLRQSFASIGQMGADAVTIKLHKYRAEDDFVVCTTNFRWLTAGHVTVKTDAGFKPGVFSTCGFQMKESATTARLKLETCELELVPPGGQAEVDEYSRILQSTADAVTGISVPEGKTVDVKHVLEWKGAFVKRGAGTLKITFEGAECGSLAVECGRLEPSIPDGAGSVKSLTVASGAEFVVPADGLTVESASLAEGAILSGGTLTVAGGARSPGVICRGGAKVVYVYDPKGADVVHEVPVWTTLPARLDPAFWVDADNAASLELRQVDTTKYVYRVNDVRGAGHAFATNTTDGLYMPILKDLNRGNKSIVFAGKCAPVSGETSDITLTDSLVWDKPIYGIRFVFQVLDRADSFGGQYLGCSSRVSGHIGDFTRAPGDSMAYFTRPIFHESACAGVLGGTFRVLDKVWDATAHGFPYYTEKSTTLDGGRYPDKHMYAPLVTSLETVEPYPAADTFDFDYGSTSRFGNKGLCELIVFTNEVSLTDRQAITAYLAKKWNNCEIVNFRPTNADGSTLGVADVTGGDLNLAVAEGGSLMVDGVTGGNTLVKSGAGTLFVPEYVNASGKLRVAEGTLELAAPALTAGDLPADPYLHFDATAIGSDYIVVDGVTNLTAWSDVRGEGYPKATLARQNSTQKPYVRTNALNGLPTVDFGEYHYDNTQSGGAVPSNSSAMSLKTTNGMHSVFAVWGSRNGGGSGILGCGGGAYNQGLGLTRGGDAYGASKDDPILRSGAKYHYPGFGGNYAYASRFFLNGEAVDPSVVGFSGGYDIVSLVTYNSFGMSALSSGGLYNRYYGGEEIGELIVYERALSEEEAKKVEAYLRMKWYGEDTVGYSAPVADSVAVEAGATLLLRGNAPLTARILSGAGTVAGSVVGAGASEIVVTVNADGSVSGLTVSGDADLSAGCTVRLDGSVGKLAAGEFVILRALGDLRVGELTMDATGVKNRFCSLAVRGGSIVLKVVKSGFGVIIR